MQGTTRTTAEIHDCPAGLRADGTANEGGALTDCPPPYSDDVTVHCGDRGDRAVWLSVSAPALEMPRDEVAFTLHNESEHALASNTGNHSFFTRQDGEWHRIVGAGRSGYTEAPDPVVVPPGETRRWQVTENTADLGGVTRPFVGEPRQFAFRFPAGDYAFGYEITCGGQRHRLTQQFEVTGSLPLEPSDAVETVSRNGETLTVRTQLDERGYQRRLTCERLSPVPPDARRLTLLELYHPGVNVRPPGSDGVSGPNKRAVKLLRDGFAHYEGGAAVIEVETTGSSTSLVGLDPGEHIDVVYDGTAWRLTA